MYYSIKVKDHIRLPPTEFEKDLKEGIIEQIKSKFSGYVSKDLGFVIDVLDIDLIEDGIIIPGDGAPYYNTTFELLTYLPEMQEVVIGKIRDITDFGAFLSLGPVDGMIHISQTMNDFVSFSKDKVLQGKESNRSLKVGDICYGRIVAVSFKDPANPKIGVTMRQQGLGKIEWVPVDLGLEKASVANK
ncbi:MAG: DNA-directed RNA polymerase [Candidatus Woesearchaeota archaeon]